MKNFDVNTFLNNRAEAGMPLNGEDLKVFLDHWNDLVNNHWESWMTPEAMAPAVFESLFVLGIPMYYEVNKAK